MHHFSREFWALDCLEHKPSPIPHLSIENPSSCLALRKSITPPPPWLSERFRQRGPPRAKTTPPAFPRDALVGSLDQSRGPWLLCTHLQTLQLPCASSRPCFPICVTPAECCTSARLANIRLGGATTTSPTPSLPTSQNHSSHTRRGQSNADNLGSADLGLIGLAVM